jgi:hypothetical protein
MRRICALFCLALCICSTLAGQQPPSKKKPVVPDTPYSFMGLVPGESKAAAVATLAALPYVPARCNNDNPATSGEGLEDCVFYGNLRDDSFVIAFVDGRVALISYTFNRSTFDSMVESIKEKYGLFKSKSSRTLQNGFGATFHSAVYVWSRPLSKITAEEFDTADKTKSTVEIEDTKLIFEAARRTLANGPKI